MHTLGSHEPLCFPLSRPSLTRLFGELLIESVVDGGSNLPKHDLPLGIEMASEAT